MKKSLSLLIAFTLLFGLTAFATEPQTKIMMSLDFDDYEDVNDFINSVESSGASIIDHADLDSSTVFNLAEKAGQDTSEGSAKIYKLGSSNISAAKSAFQTNAFGKTTFRTAVGGVSRNDGAGLLFIPAESWNFETNKDEILVFSYDIEANPSSTDSRDTFYADISYWADAERERHNKFYLIRKLNDASNVTLYANARDRVDGNPWRNDISKGKTYRLAYGWTYGTGNVNNDGTNDYYFPTRIFAKNGGPWDGTNLNSTTKPTDNHVWSKRKNFIGIKLAWFGPFGLEYADILMYTVKNDPSAFKVSMVDDTVEYGESAIVKFNHPIYAGSVKKESLTVKENGSTFTMYDIGKIENVIDDVTGEVYSTVEILFPYGNKPETTYEVKFNLTDNPVSSEIGWKLQTGNNITSFTTGSAPANVVTISANSGLAGDGSSISSIASEQAKFTAVATASDVPSFLFVGIYDGPTLVSYTYTTASTGDEISLATKVESGYTVKAFSCGNLYDLTQIFGSGDQIGDQIN